MAKKKTNPKKPASLLLQQVTNPNAGKEPSTNNATNARIHGTIFVSNSWTVHAARFARSAIAHGAKRQSLWD
jgi:hypothetical protein